MFSTSISLALRLALLCTAFLSRPTRSLRTEVVGQSGVNAQMAFLDTDDTVIFLDKTQNNPLRIDDRPAWAARFNVRTGQAQPFDLITNTFCAGGAQAGDGSIVVTGGNIAVGRGGVAANQSTAPYFAVDGGFAVNVWHPTTKRWTTRRRGLRKERWYPSMEPLADGSVAIIGGQSGGGYSGTDDINEPTIEIYPDRGLVEMPMLKRAVPMNLFPLTYLMSNGKMFVQAYNEAVLWDLKAHTEEPLPRKPGAPGPYPANQAVALLPLTPANKYTETVLFCGGLEGLSKVDWGGLHGPNVSVTDKLNSRACQSIAPLGDRIWHTLTRTPEGRTMAMFVALADGNLLWVGGGRYGSAGYGPPGSVGKPVGHSYSTGPGLGLWTFNPQTYGWSFAGSITKPRLYHSSAVLLPDGSVIIAGSSPNPDVSQFTYRTEYTVERWFPSWHNRRRPDRNVLPSTFAYGHAVRINLRTAATQGGVNATAITSAKLRLVRTGFSTHAIQWGQRTLEVQTHIAGDFLVGTFISNRNLFAPGPALAFLEINGIPSFGKFVQVGPQQLPAS